MAWSCGTRSTPTSTRPVRPPNALPRSGRNLMAEESAASDLVELMRKAYEAVNRRDFDLDAMMSFYAPDALWESPPLGTRFEGRAAIRGFAEDWMSAYEEWHASRHRSSHSGAGGAGVRVGGWPDSAWHVL